MSTLMTNSETSRAVGVRFTEDLMYVVLSDGQEISVPIELFPRLKQATPAQRNNWRFIGKGLGIHWNDIDEDLSVKGLLEVVAK